MELPCAIFVNYMYICMSLWAREDADYRLLIEQANHLFAVFCNNCRGVSAVSFPAHGSHIYTAGADGMVCEIDSMSGNLLNKFSAASKAISSLAISPGTSHIICLVVKSFIVL